MATYKSYDAVFKEYVTKLIVKDGRRMVDVSNELNIPYDTLANWVKVYRKKEREAEKATQNQLLTASEYRDLYEAELKEKLDLQEEIEILKKAMHIFTQGKN
ncbi:transposase [Lederbergia panacisoli]|uniref:transposase n=1 Tax=Lederbergia panacisoli TaxID=1255251 RepID=UPI00214BC8FF|nr:transposase [Lederbergia panacisoli]MCR2823900.1 transposase [Lederbergia panacisoli]